MKRRLLAAAALAVLVAAGVGGAAAASDNDEPAATTAPTAAAPGVPALDDPTPPDCEDATIVIKDGKIYANGKEIGKVEKGKPIPALPSGAPGGVGVDAGASAGGEGPVRTRADEAVPEGAIPAKGAITSVHSENGKITVTEGEFDGEPPPPPVPGKPGEPGKAGEVGTASSGKGESGPSVHVEGVAPTPGSGPQMIVACSVKTVQGD